MIFNFVDWKLFRLLLSVVRRKNAIRITSIKIQLFYEIKAEKSCRTLTERIRG